MPTRREILASTAALAATTMLWKNPGVAHAAEATTQPAPEIPVTPQNQNLSYTPVHTPNGSTLPFRTVDGVKVFHLTAQPVLHTFAPGLQAHCWGYNNQVHGPTIEAVEGDRVRIYVTNKLPAPTTVHWHGMILPSGMDGVGGINQPPINPGETYKYEFPLLHPGTFMYHSHHDEMTQMALGLMGMIVVHPQKPTSPPPDRDYVLMLSEWSIKPGTSRPDPNEMTDFNILTINAKCFPGTAPLVASRGERVRIRLGNLSGMDHHPIHLHGYSFRTVATDGGPVPPSAQYPETTVLVPTGATRDIEFIADNPGDWAMHCHMTHHVMNQMGHGIPNVIATNPATLDKAIGKAIPGYMAMGETGMGDMMMMDTPKNSLAMQMAQGPHGVITMGGMFTILKVRQQAKGFSDPGWYDAPKNTRATQASLAELTRDGITP
jgi:manganese oxidase